MAQYSKQSLNALRERIDLIEVVSGYLTLKRSGGYYKAPCPFHSEKTPSFVIQKGEDHYHCFGCGAHGDAISFLMNHLKLSFVEAVETLASKYGVALEENSSEEAKEENKAEAQKRRLKEVLATAADFYQFYLLHSKEGEEVLDYLYERGIDNAFILQFGVGLAPDDGRMQLEYFAEKGATMDLLEKAALAKKDSKGRLRPFFQGRVVFPIRDPMGGVIGFSARKYREETFGPKYINTSETPLFKKSHVLFGLNESRRRIAKQRRALIVEGQIDALRLIQEGLNFCVAGQGTAFGAHQVAQLIKLGVSRVDIAFDGDQAGQEAAMKVGQLFQKEGVDVNVLRMDEGLDPDSIIKEGGVEAFLEVIERGQDYLSFLTEKLCEQVNVETPAGKNQLVQMISERIGEWEHPVMVYEAHRRISELLQIPESAIKDTTRSSDESYIKRSMSVGNTSIDPHRILEIDLLRWMAFVGGSDIELFDQIKNNIAPDDLHTSVCRRIFQKCLEVYDAQKSLDLLSVVVSLEDAEEQLFLSEILSKRINTEKAREGIHTCLEKILQRNWMIKRESIRSRIHRGGVGEEEMFELARQFDALKRDPPKVKVE